MFRLSKYTSSESMTKDCVKYVYDIEGMIIVEISYQVNHGEEYRPATRSLQEPPLQWKLHENWSFKKF